MANIQLLLGSGGGKNLLFFVRNEHLYVAKASSPLSSPYPEDDLRLIYTGKVNSFSAVERNTGRLECVIDTPDKGLLVYYSDMGGMFWQEA